MYAPTQPDTTIRRRIRDAYRYVMDFLTLLVSILLIALALFSATGCGLFVAGAAGAGAGYVAGHEAGEDAADDDG